MRIARECLDREAKDLKFLFEFLSGLGWWTLKF
jgi:hypothetical protein